MWLFVSPHDLSYVVLGVVEEEGARVSKVARVAKVSRVARVVTRPEGILVALLGFLASHKIKPEDLDGIIVVTGPGSFTALRAGLSVVNTFAFVHAIPLCSCTNPDGKPPEELLKTVDFSTSTAFVTPEYGREPNITSPRL